jgi:hypothetical protein
MPNNFQLSYLSIKIMHLNSGKLKDFSVLCIVSSYISKSAFSNNLKCG